MLASPSALPHTDLVLARIRSAHLKAAADVALAAGNAGEAAAGYGAAAAALPAGAPPSERARLASNRALAWLRAGRPAPALAAASEAVSLAPAWDKAHWRLAAALAGAGRHVEALAALRACAAAGGDPPAVRLAAARAVARLPRRDVARCLMSLLEDGVVGGRLPEAPVRDGDGAGRALAVPASNSLAPPRTATNKNKNKKALALIPDVRPSAASSTPTTAALLAAAERLVAVGEGRAAEEGLAGEGEGDGAPPPPPSSPHPSAPASDAPPPPPTAGGAASAFAGQWRAHLAAWVLDADRSLHAATALGERSAIAAEAGGWAGAVVDGRAAVDAAASDPATPPLTCAHAHLRLAEACLAAPGVAGRDCRAAAAAAVAGLARLPPSPPGKEEGATKERPPASPAQRAATAIKAGLTAVLRSAEADLPTGAVGDLVRSQPGGIGLTVRLAYPPPASLSPAARARLVPSLAAACEGAAGTAFPHTAISIEGVRRVAGGGLVVRAGVRAPGAAAAAALVSGLVGGSGLSLLRLGDGGGGDNAGGAAYCPAVSVELEVADQKGPACSALAAAPPQLSLSLPPPPPRARLTTAAGAPLDGPPRAGGGTARRHPFRLSRIHYAARDLPPDAWVELPDGRVRWRQSAGEVRVVVAASPRGLCPASLSIRFRPRRVTVRARLQPGDATLTTLWDARLARHIVPGESTWAAGNGAGEDGLVLGLVKANLELLAGGEAAPATPADTWWPRLTAAGGGGVDGAGDGEPGGLAWDDYDKDYSDLPAPYLAAEAAASAAAAADRCAEASERAERAACHAEDGARVRARAERLDALRGAVLTGGGV